ncbi:hypothetical protein HDU98_005638 [Podochytrium sp. JEL0797]|nr:hypothetical protein HDU98_005638 [Podochytrium sp. JEL0797]
MADVLGPVVSRQLQEKLYDKRKSAALEVERIVREAHGQRNEARVDQVIRVVVRDFAYSPLPNARNGGLIALAAVAIALGSDGLRERLDQVTPPILACFADPDIRVRYYACEAMYNVAKVARRALLLYFNELLDALSRLVADLDASVKDGAELLDRLVKDIVCEHAAFVSLQAGSAENSMPGRALPSEPAFPAAPGSRPIKDNEAFDFPRFIPLLAERIKAVNPLTRMFLLQWIATLVAIPFLELVSYLPDFLDGLFTYISDPNMDVRTSTLNILAEFLKEIQDVVSVTAGASSTNATSAAISRHTSLKKNEPRPRSAGESGGHGGNNTLSHTESHQLLPSHQPLHYRKSTSSPDFEEDPTIRRPTSSLSLASAFFAENRFARPTPITTTTSSASMPQTHQNQHFTPLQIPLDFSKIITILLPYLSSHDEETQATALGWMHEFVLGVVQPPKVIVGFTAPLLSAILPCLAHRVTPIKNSAGDVNTGLLKLVAEFAVVPGEDAVFDVKGAVDALTKQFLDENEETRVASLDWLLMLHKKAPKKVFFDLPRWRVH